MLYISVFMPLLFRGGQGNLIYTKVTVHALVYSLKTHITLQNQCFVMLLKPGRLEKKITMTSSFFPLTNKPLFILRFFIRLVF